MKNKETLKFINDNIKGKKITIFILSLTQILLGVATVALSFMLRYIIASIEGNDYNEFVKYTIILGIIALLVYAVRKVGARGRDVYTVTSNTVIFALIGDQTLKVVP